VENGPHSDGLTIPRGNDTSVAVDSVCETTRGRSRRRCRPRKCCNGPTRWPSLAGEERGKIRECTKLPGDFPLRYAAAAYAKAASHLVPYFDRRSMKRI
jgi:hypothetical protein